MNKRQLLHFLAAGIIALILYELPYLVQGENSHIRIHDNLDSPANVYAAMFFKENANQPEALTFILGGLPDTCKAPLIKGVTFAFWLLPPYWAYTLNDFVVRLVGFIGMFLLLLQLGGKNDYLIFGVSLAFGFLPFYSIYGLSVTALPLFTLVLVLALKRDKTVYTIVAVLALSILLPFYVSLSFSGIYVILLMGLVWLVNFIKFRRPQPLLMLSIVLIILAFLTAEFDLIANEFSTKPIIWHRQEFASTKSFLLTAKETISLIVLSYYHAEANPFPFIWSTIGLYGVLYLRHETGAILKYRHVILCLSFITVATLSYFIFNEGEFLSIGKKLGFLRSFNMSRLYVFFPLVFSYLFYVTLSVLYKSDKKARILALGLVCCQIAFCFGRSDWIVYRNEPSYSEFVSHSLFNKAEMSIGKNRASFRIACLGFHPSIAHFNGYQTVDGYWIVFPLKYKHSFRRVIDKELDKSSSLRSYFDDWGSRCYLMSSEIGRNFYVTKNNAIKQVQNLQLNTRYLKDQLHASYIFSSVEIANSERLKLSLVDAIVDDSSAIDLYIYKISDH